MKRFFSVLICVPAVVLLAGPAAAACVENGTSETLYFTIESRTGDARIGAALDPGAELCMPDTSSAIFTALSSGTSVEGCPRLSGPDGRDRLMHFLPTDSCRWASHGE